MSANTYQDYTRKGLTDPNGRVIVVYLTSPRGEKISPNYSSNKPKGKFYQNYATSTKGRPAGNMQAYATSTGARMNQSYATSTKRSKNSIITTPARQREAELHGQLLHNLATELAGSHATSPAHFFSLIFKEQENMRKHKICDIPKAGMNIKFDCAGGKSNVLHYNNKGFLTKVHITSRRLLTGTLFDSDTIRMLSKCVELEEFSLKDQGLTGTIPEEVIEKWVNLRVLHLSGNKLSGPIPPSLSRRKRLEILDLNGNRRLKMTNSAMYRQFLEDLMHRQNLRVIDLGGLDKLGSATFKLMDTRSDVLERMVLTGTQIKVTGLDHYRTHHIPHFKVEPDSHAQRTPFRTQTAAPRNSNAHAFFDQLWALQNGLREASADKRRGGKWDDIKKLMAGKEYLPRGPVEVAFNENGEITEILTKLQLNLDGELESCDVGNGAFPALRVLDLRGERHRGGITKVWHDGLKELGPTLRVVDFQGNRLTELPRSLMTCTNVEIMDFSENMLDFALKKGQFSKFRKLEMLSFHHNEHLRGGLYISNFCGNIERLYDPEAVLEIDVRSTNVLTYFPQGARAAVVSGSTYRIHLKIPAGLQHMKILVHTNNKPRLE